MQETVVMKSNQAEFYRLEDRVLFEAGAVVQAAEAAAAESGANEAADSSAAAETQMESASVSDVQNDIADLASVELPPEVIAETAAESDPEKVLVVINSSVADAGKIVNDLGENYEILYLRSGTDALDTINDYLDAHSDTSYSALHIVSHGNDGYITLNGEKISNATLNPADWKAIGEHLTDDADILLYGCNTASSDEGKALVQTIANLTGADVAASTDSTGANGDWDLEYQTALIESATLAPAGYEYSLNKNQVTITVGEDVGNIQEALEKAKEALTDEADEITIKFAEAGTVKLDRTSGALSIAQNVFTGDDCLIIDGDADEDGIGDIIFDGGLDWSQSDNFYGNGKNSDIGTQIMNIASGNTVTLRNLTFQNGYALSSGTRGGAISNAGTLTIQSSLLKDNYSEWTGGAVYSSGTLIVESSTFYHNGSESGGGAIALGSTATVTLVNTTLAKNMGVATDTGAINAGNGATLYLINSVLDGQIVNNGRENIGNNPNSANSLLTYCVYHDADPGNSGDKSTLDGNLDGAYKEGKATLTTVAEKNTLITDSFSGSTLITKGEALTKGTLVGKIGTDYYYLDHTDSNTANWKWVKAIRNAAESDKFDFDSTGQKNYGLGANAVILSTSQNGVDRIGDLTTFSAGAYQNFLTVTASGYTGVADGKVHTVTIEAKAADGSQVEITYKGDGESAFDATAPEYTHPGTYTVEYIAAGTKETITGTLTVTLYKPLTVNTADDPETFDLTDSVLSLREAVTVAMSSPKEYGIISFAESLKGQSVTLSAGALPELDGVTLTINGDVDGDGIGDITLDGNSQYQIMNIAANADVTLEYLTIQGGHSNGAVGAVTNAGILTVRHALFQNNSNTGANGAGAIYNSNKLYVEDSSFYNNTGNSSNGGGAIYSSGSKTQAVVVNSTFTGNSGHRRSINAGNEALLYLLNDIFDEGANDSVRNNPSFSSLLSYSVYISGKIDTRFTATNMVQQTALNTTETCISSPVEFSNGSIVTTGVARTNGTLVGRIGQEYYYLDHSSADPSGWKWVKASDRNISCSYDGSENAVNYGLGAEAVILSKSQNGGDRTKDMSVFTAGSYQEVPKEILLYTVERDSGGSIIAEDSAGSYHTVQEAVDAAAAGSEYLIRFNGDYFKEGKYTLTPDAAITIGAGLNITIDGDVGDNGTADIIFDGNNKVQILNIAAGSTVTVQNLTFRNAYSDTNGGAVYNGGSTLNIINTDFLNNTAQTSGGAIYTEGTLNVTGGEFKGNMAVDGIAGGGYNYCGSGIFINSGTVNIDSTTFTENGDVREDYITGAIVGRSAGIELTISNATFDGNAASTWGAAIYMEGGKTLSVCNSTFKNHTGGAAIYAQAVTDITSCTFKDNLNGSLEIQQNCTIKDSTFHNNKGGSWGSILVRGGSTAIINSIFTNNSGDNGGGAIYLWTGNNNVLSIINSTFVGNNASNSSYGGAVTIWTGTMNVVNSIFANNTSVGNACDFYTGGKTANFYYSVFESSSSITANVESEASFTDRTIFTGYDHGDYTLTGDGYAADGGTLVGKVGDAFYYKAGTKWLKVGGTASEYIPFEEDADNHYGLGKAEGTEVYSSDLNGKSRVDILSAFSMGAYAADIQIAPAGPLTGVTIDVRGDANKTYDGDSVTLTAIPTGGEGEFLYKWYKDGSTDVYSDKEFITVTNVNESGSYRVEVTAGEVTEESSLQTVEITEATMTVSAPDVKGVADGVTKHTITVTPEIFGSQTATITYGTKDGIYDLSVSPAYTAEGKYTVYYKVTADNYKDYTGSAVITLTEPADPADVAVLLYRVDGGTETSAGVFGSIQAAISAAETNGEYIIRFNKTVFGEDADRTVNIDANTKLSIAADKNLNITIDGLLKDVNGNGLYDEGDTRIILDGGRNNGTGGVQILSIGAGNTVTVKNLTFRNAYHDGHGSAISCNGSSLDIVNTDFLNNETNGNGVYGTVYCNGAGVLTVTGSEFKGNSSSWGAAIYLNNSVTNAVIVNSVFTENSSGSSGVICNYSSAPLTVINSTFVNNSKGAINPWDTGGTYVINCIFVGNGTTEIAQSGSKPIHLYYSVYEHDSTKSYADANSIQSTGADVFGESYAATGFAPGIPVGDAANSGTLVGQIGGEFVYYHKGSGKWVKLDGTVVQDFSSDAPNYGLGTDTGTIVYTADKSGTSRTDDLSAFTVGAYTYKYETAEIVWTVSNNGIATDNRLYNGLTYTVSAILKSGGQELDLTLVAGIDTTLNDEGYINAGTYNFTIDGISGTGIIEKDGIQYKLADIDTSKYSLTITPRTLTVTADNGNKVYGETDPVLTYTVGGDGLAAGDTKDKVFTGSLSRKAGDDAGEYAITLGTLSIATGNSNYIFDSSTGFTAGKFKITPFVLNGKINWTPEDKVFDGEKKEIAVSYNNKGVNTPGTITLTYTVTDGDSALTNAGDYTLKAELATEALKENYTWGSDVVLTYNYTIAPQSVVITPSGNGIGTESTDSAGNKVITVTGNQLWDLKITPSGSTSSLPLILKEGSTEITDLTTLGVGEHTLQYGWDTDNSAYSPTLENNYDETFKSVILVVTQAGTSVELNETVTSIYADRKAAEQKFTVDKEITVGGYTLTASYEFTLKVSANDKGYYDAGTYTDLDVICTDVKQNGVSVYNAGIITITDNGKTYTYSLNTDSADCSVVIQSAEFSSAEGTDYSGTYDGKVHTGSVTAKTVDNTSVTVKYMDAVGNYTLDEAPEYTDAGTYTVKYQISAENHETVIGDYVVRIDKVTDKVTVTITGNSGEFTYDGKEHTVKGYDVKISGDNDLYAEGNIKFTGTDEIKGTDVSASGDMGLTKDMFSNANNNFTDVEFVVTDGYLTIGNADITATAEDYSGIYDGEAHNITVGNVAVVNDQAYRIEYSLTGIDGSYSDSLELKNVSDSATVYYKISAANHNDLTGSAKVTIGKRSLMLTSGDYSGVYDGAEHKAETVTGDNFVNDETFVYSGFASIKNAGSAKNTFTYADGTALAENYEITVVNGTLTVSKRAVTVQANDVKVNVSEPVVLTYQIVSGSLAAGDSFTGELECSGADAQQPGEYAITQGKLALTDNYILTFINGTLTVAGGGQNAEQQNGSQIQTSITFAGVANTAASASNRNGLPPVFSSTEYENERAAGYIFAMEHSGLLLRADGSRPVVEDAQFRTLSGILGKNMEISAAPEQETVKDGEQHVTDALSGEEFHGIGGFTAGEDEELEKLLNSQDFDFSGLQSINELSKADICKDEIDLAIDAMMPA